MTRCGQCTCRDCGNTMGGRGKGRDVEADAYARLRLDNEELRRHNRDLRGAVVASERRIGLGAVEIVMSLDTSLLVPVDESDVASMSGHFPGFQLRIESEKPASSDQHFVWVVRPSDVGSVYERLERAATRLMEAAHEARQRERKETP